MFIFASQTFCFYNTSSFASTRFLLHSFLKLMAHLVFIIGIIKMLLFFNLFPQHFLILHLQLYLIGGRQCFFQQLGRFGTQKTVLRVVICITPLAHWPL